MKIVIAGGSHAADYIIKNFKSSNNKLIIINPDKNIATELSNTNKVPVLYGDPSHFDILKQAHIENSDLFIALGDIDTDNYAACITAKLLFNIKKCICIVSNPNIVDLYKTLGIDAVISATYLLASSVVAESSLEDLYKSTKLEDDKVVLTEVIVKENSVIANKKIAEINFPKIGSISCIYRRPNVIIPNGQITILPKDKLLIVSSSKDQTQILNFIKQKEN